MQNVSSCTERAVHHWCTGCTSSLRHGFGLLDRIESSTDNWIRCNKNAFVAAQPHILLQPLCDTTDAIWHTRVQAFARYETMTTISLQLKIEFVCMSMFRCFLSHYANHLPTHTHTHSECSCNDYLKLNVAIEQAIYRPTKTVPTNFATTTAPSTGPIKIDKLFTAFSFGHWGSARVWRTNSLRQRERARGR